MNKFKSTTLVEKFLKYTSSEFRANERKKRILTIILLPVWLTGLIVTIIFTIQGTKAIPLYYRAKSLIPKQIELEKAIRDRPLSNSIIEHYDFDPSPWKEIGIENPTPTSTMMPEFGMEIQKKKMYKLLSPIAYLVIFFLIPIFILRLIFWVKKADKNIA